MRDLGRLLIFAGAALIVAGVLFTLFGKMKMPGDIVYRRGNFTLYVPIVTSIVLSILLSALLWLFRR
jgi:Protein of unknown function (DUF2905)